MEENPWARLLAYVTGRINQELLLTAYENVPGRRTDWHECQWLQYLHSVGLLRAAFRAEATVTAVRTIMRHRHELVQDVQSAHSAHAQGVDTNESTDSSRD